ncbi:MAG TPA: family 1 glycosylhydrolase [Chryseosolibacter sp.]|nr:family 1 glycosylhydrolase [Chryseosolibacter sp.]
MEKKFSSIPELWGGLECSFNRVKGKYFDQLAYSKHYDRIAEDLQAIAALGITSIRYPVIWEKYQPKRHSSIYWDHAELALTTLQQYRIKPIVGLVHHGSGPKYADVTMPGFATELASYAAKVAEKFPWLDYYTPVNEPLTTARFSGLYALWYPHRRNDRAFVQILLNELKGVVLSMAEIRKINPDAKLVQTEDLAKIYSTPLMAYQAEFENHRRWLTFDILCGRVRPGHPLWAYLQHYAASATDLHFFEDNPCPPDILGMDYYATSERYLDEDLERYPSEKHGHNHRHRYADVEAIRVRHNEASGIQVLLREAWERYRIPIAVTEVHMNCDYDNQIRWFGEIRNACIALRGEDIDIRAVTSWSLLGAYGWNSLLTEPMGDYESGAFDVSCGHAVRTPVGDYIAALSADPLLHHPAMNEKGWWSEENRYLFERNSPAELASRDQPLNQTD